MSISAEAILPSSPPAIDAAVERPQRTPEQQAIVDATKQASKEAISEILGTVVGKSKATYEIGASALKLATEKALIYGPPAIEAGKEYGAKVAIGTAKVIGFTAIGGLKGGLILGKGLSAGTGFLAKSGYKKARESRLAAKVFDREKKLSKISFAEMDENQKKLRADELAAELGILKSKNALSTWSLEKARKILSAEDELQNHVGKMLDSAEYSETRGADKWLTLGGENLLDRLNLVRRNAESAVWIAKLEKDHVYANRSLARKSAAVLATGAISVGATLLTAGFAPAIAGGVGAATLLGKKGIGVRRSMLGKDTKHLKGKKLADLKSDVLDKYAEELELTPTIDGEPAMNWMVNGNSSYAEARTLRNDKALRRKKFAGILVKSALMGGAFGLASELIENIPEGSVSSVVDANVDAITVDEAQAATRANLLDPKINTPELPSLTENILEPGELWDSTPDSITADYLYGENFSGSTVTFEVSEGSNLWEAIKAADPSLEDREVMNTINYIQARTEFDVNNIPPGKFTVTFPE